MPFQPKAARDGYSPAPFVFQERMAGGARLVAWTGDVDQLRRLFLHLVSLLPETVDVLLKVEPDLKPTSADDDDERANSVDDWQRYIGECPRSVLLRGMAMCDAFVFSDSRCQLLIRDPESH